MPAGGIQARSSGASTGDVLIDGAAAVPAGGLGTRSRAASATDRPAIRPVCEELTALAPGRVLPFAPGDSRKRGPKLSQEVKALASAAAERREASAPEARCGGNVAVAWRAPRPKRAQAVTSGRVARLVMRKAPVGAPPPFYFFGAAFLQWLGKARARTKNASRERDFFVLPCARDAHAGKGKEKEAPCASAIIPARIPANSGGHSTARGAAIWSSARRPICSARSAT